MTADHSQDDVEDGDEAEAADGEAGVDHVGPADDVSRVVNVFDAVI